MSRDQEIAELLKEIYGYSDWQLLAEFEAAERQLQEFPELLEELKPPQGEFEKIIEATYKRRKLNGAVKY